jgi:hypothetical protein
LRACVSHSTPRIRKPKRQRRSDEEPQSRHLYCRIADSKMMAQASERSMPSYAPKSFTETEIENRLAIAREREAMNSVQNRVPSAADRVSSFDIWRHYHKRDRNLMGPILPSISRVTGKVVLIGFHSSDYGVISNDADRFKRFHSYCFGVHEHTLPMARESRLCGCVVSLVSPQPARAVSASSIRCGPPNISSVTIDHDELCDLPLGRRVA